MLATLNHTNVAGIYGLENAGNSPALVLELIEGEDLSQRVKRGPLPGGEATEICRQVGQALEAVHEKGIVKKWCINKASESEELLKIGVELTVFRHLAYNPLVNPDRSGHYH